MTFIPRFLSSMSKKINLEKYSGLIIVGFITLGGILLLGAILIEAEIWSALTGICQ